jgi:hypothetical protein
MEIVELGPSCKGSGSACEKRVSMEKVVEH